MSDLELSLYAEAISSQGLKALRTLLDLNMHNFANSIGMGVATLNRFELGEDTSARVGTRMKIIRGAIGAGFIPHKERGRIGLVYIDASKRLAKLLRLQSVSFRTGKGRKPQDDVSIFLDLASGNVDLLIGFDRSEAGGS